MRHKELRELGEQRLRDLGFRPPLAGAQTLPPVTGRFKINTISPLSPDAAPLAGSPPHLLPPAEEPLALVEVEVLLRELRLQPQEGLQEAELVPGRPDELVAVHHVDLSHGEGVEPPGSAL